MKQNSSYSQHTATVTHHSDGSKTIHLTAGSAIPGSIGSSDTCSTCTPFLKPSECPAGQRFQSCGLLPVPLGQCCSSNTLSQTAQSSPSSNCSECDRNRTSCPSPLVMQSCQYTSGSWPFGWVNGKRCCSVPSTVGNWSASDWLAKTNLKY